MTNPWNLLPDDVRELVDVAVEEFAKHPYTGPMPEEHVCRFGEIVATGDLFDTYRCVLRWSDDTRCNWYSTDPRYYTINRYLARPPDATA